MPGFIGYSLHALVRTRRPLAWTWCVCAGLVWVASWGLPALDRSPLVNLIAWGAGLLLLSAAGLARWLHPTLLLPTLSMAMSSMAVASILSLGTGYEQAIDELTAKTQGDAVVTRSGRDFHEYPEVAPGLEALPAVKVALPFVYVEGLAQAKGQSEGPVLSRGMVLRGIAPQTLARSRIFAHARATQKLKAPEPADRDQRPGLWLGAGLAAGIGAKVGDLVLLTVWSRQARRDETGLHYDYAPRERLFVLDAIFETGDQQMDEHLAVSALSAAQALAHGRAWVTGIDLEWDTSRPMTGQARLAQVQSWLDAHAKLCRVSSWRDSPERDEQRRRFLGISAVLSFGLMSSSTVGFVLGVLVLLRLRTHFFRSMHAMGARPGQLRALLAALLGTSLGLTLLLFAGWWVLLACVAPPLSFSVDVLGTLSLTWTLRLADVIWIAVWLFLSYGAAYSLLSRQLPKFRT